MAVQEEREAVMRICLLAILIGMWSGSTVVAQDWAKAMFERDGQDHTSHDFGVIARGAKVQHRFKLENIYLEDVHIASVSSTCNCTIPEFTKDTLKTYETAEIIATIDTRTFLGRKQATVRVKFDKPFPAEVQLHVYCYIRSDVVVEPGEAQFGTINQGTSVRKKLSVTYAGRSDWSILGVQCSSPFLEGKVVETSRAYGRVAYDLWVELKDNAPQGYLKDVLMLVTNDRNPNAAKVPVAVEGLVIGTLSAQPSPLSLGILQVGQTTKKNLVVQGKEPFRILSMTSDEKRLEFRIPDPNSGPRPVHVVPVIFVADGTTGQISTTIRIRTDLAGGGTLEVKVDGMVLSKESVPTRDSARSGSSGAASGERTDGWKPAAP
jgi:hypothetical protein